MTYSVVFFENINLCINFRPAYGRMPKPESTHSYMADIRSVT